MPPTAAYHGLYRNIEISAPPSPAGILGSPAFSRSITVRGPEKRPAETLETEMFEFQYSGDELALFSLAANWKAYWSSQIASFVGDCILDVGAGIGTTARALNFKRYKKWVGIEPDKSLCEIASREKANGTIPSHVEIRHGTTADIPPDEQFDTALYIDVLEHIEDHKEELIRVGRNISAGGNVLIVVPAHNFLYTDFDRKIGHFRRYDKKTMLAAIPENFRVRQMRYLDSVGMAASLANKLLLKSDTPTVGQIRFWDNVMVRASRMADPLFGYTVGKSMICVLNKISG